MATIATGNVPAPAAKSSKFELRAWCRTKYGALWHEDKSVRLARLAEARNALGAPNKEAPKKKNPIKTVYSLTMGNEEEGEESRCCKVKGTACINGKFLPLAKEKVCSDPPFWAVWFFPPDEFDDDDDGGIYVGSHPCPGYGDKYDYGFVRKDDTPEQVAQTILKLENGVGDFIQEGGFGHGERFPIQDHILVIHKDMWMQITRPTRERLLRDSFAEVIYIADFL